MASGAGSFRSEVLSLGAVAVVIALGVAHFDKVKPFLSAQLAEHLPQAATAAKAQESKDAAAPARTSGVVELRAGENGHYHTEAEINGRGIEVMVDTGASTVALTYRDAEQAGIFLSDSDFTHKVSTANGIARVAPVMLDKVSIGEITVRNVQGVVAEDGKLATTLLGMSFLRRLERFEMRGDTLLLQE